MRLAGGIGLVEQLFEALVGDFCKCLNGPAGPVMSRAPTSR